MILEEYFNYRQELLDQSKDEEGFVQQSLFLSQVLPSMQEAKLIDTEEANDSYYSYGSENMKVNAYCVNDSGERLQLFIVNEDSIDLTKKDKELQISTKSYYESQFKRATKFLNKAFKRHLNDEIQDSSPVRALISQISSSQGAHQFDVVEIFLVSATSTVSLMGSKPQPKHIDFISNELKVTYTKDRENRTKNILIKKRLIDLNFLYNVLISQGNREALTVDFEQIFGKTIESIKAADEKHFESYLCVLPAKLIATLYKEHSTRLLEKNVRSFLQFRGVNKGIRETIRIEPEKFIAYNNGLTITATEGSIIDKAGKTFISSLTDFQIVNGGQTTATIYFTQKDGFDISKVNVMAKINIAKKNSDEELEELITNISTFSNAQSRVSKVDLRSRNPQLVRLKSLSESVLTPSGLKWFFERAKGEFNTKLRIAGSNKNRLKKEYPNERRFSKEQLAKYYSAWGNEPYMVKKGGEKVFRLFIEEISGEGKSKKLVEINRVFYEDLIAKIILFRKLEKIYGQGKNSMGQIRSAVIPYTIAVLYSYTDSSKKSRPFDLLKIWLQEGLESDLTIFFTELLSLMNDLIKKYSESDDYGEYSKKPELWTSIIGSYEIEEFMQSVNATRILKKYSVSEEDQKKRSISVVEVNFKNVNDNILVHTNGVGYYESISSALTNTLTTADEAKISIIKSSIINRKDLDDKLLDFEKGLINRIRVNNPEVFDQLSSESNYIYYDTLNSIIKKYNTIIELEESFVSEFDKIRELGEHRGIEFATVFSHIGNQFERGVAPTVEQIYYASNYYNKDSEPNSIIPQKIDFSKIVITDLLMRKMVEWDSKYRVLSVKQQAYIADFAYGLNRLTAFHEKNIRNYLEKLNDKGFKL